MKKTLLLLLASAFILSGCGQTGPQGPKGDPGQNGINGEKGNDGVSVVSIIKTSTSGLVDTYTITYSDGKTSKFTVTNGKSGIDGLPGDDGHSPVVTISEDGYWVIDGIKTSTLAKGVNGEDGIDGTSFLNGTSDPGTQIGKNGDCYLNTTTNDVFYKENGVWSKIGNLQGDEGKSAYETYLEYHQEYQKSEEEWINEFCVKDETDYSSYDDFEFVPITYGGVKGYSASYIGTGGDIVIPKTFNLEPVLGFKFGFDEMHELLEEDPGYKVNSIYFPSNVRFFAINGNSNYAIHCLVETAFIFTASLDEVIYTNFVFEEICFDGLLEELEDTNLMDKFAISNIYVKDSGGDYYKAIDNFDKYATKYAKIREKVELLKDTYVPDMMTKFDDGYIDIPTEITYQYEGDDLQVPVKVLVNDETAACSAYQNRLTYASSNIDHFKGKEVFLVDFVFELEGEKHVGSSSTVIISKKPNIFKTFDISFDLVEYNEFDSRFIGNLYSKRLSVKFKEGSKQIKAYIENGFGIFETAMPVLADDPVGFVSPFIQYDAKNQCFNCTKAGDYSLGFGYVAGDKEFVFHANELDTFGTKISQTIIEFLQNNFVSHGGTVYVNVDDTIVFPESLDVVVDGKLITFSVTLEAGPQHFFVDGTKVTFLLENDDPAFSSLTFRASNDEERLYSSFYIGFNIFK